MLASRFNVLKIDDDSDAPSSDDETRNARTKAGSKANKDKNRRKKTANQRSQTAELRALAFGTGKASKKGASTKKPGGGTNQTEQWNEWKQKDETLVTESFEDDLAKAILLSKVDYEEKRDLYETNESQETTKGKKKQKPSKTVSLDAFKQMTPVQVEQLSEGVLKPPAPRPVSPKQDKNFFHRVIEETREELRREERRRLVLEGPRVSSSESGFEREHASPDSDKGRISPVSSEASGEVSEQVAQLTAQLEVEKSRTKRLMSIFKDTEIKEKAKLIVESERANRVISELTTQVTDLHEKLEQERSKVHSMTDEIKKLQEQLQRHRTSSENQ